MLPIVTTEMTSRTRPAPPPRGGRARAPAPLPARPARAPACPPAARGRGQRLPAAAGAPRPAAPTRTDPTAAAGRRRRSSERGATRRVNGAAAVRRPPAAGGGSPCESAAGLAPEAPARDLGGVRVGGLRADGGRVFAGTGGFSPAVEFILARFRGRRWLVSFFPLRQDGVI